MIKFALFVALVLLATTSCNNPRQDSVVKKPIPYQMIQGVGTSSELNGPPNTIILFFWPEKLDWPSDLYADHLPYREKLAILKAQIAKRGRANDNLKRRAYNLELQLERMCSDEYPDVCDQMGVDLEKLYEEIEMDTDAILGFIQNNIDADINQPVNWITSDTDESKFVLGRKGKKERIELNLSDFSVDYSSRDGDIFKLDFNREKRRLNFSLKEKDENGDYTGAIYEFKLEDSVLGNDRYLIGEVKSYVGGRIRHGIAKFLFDRE